MKQIFLFVLISFSIITAQSQNEWLWTGNTDVVTTGVLGSSDTDVIDLLFRTSTGNDRMRIFGSDGDIEIYGRLSLGITNTLAGTRTIAHGFTNSLDGENTGAFGMYNTITSASLAAFALGGFNEVSGDYSIALGYNNKATNEGAIAMGDECEANGHDAIAGGEVCHSDGLTSISFGYNLWSELDHTITLGRGAQS